MKAKKVEKCYKCGTTMVEKKGALEDGPEYEYFSCPKCGEEVLDMQQLHDLAEREKKLRKAKQVRFSKWGNSIGVRIPKQQAKEAGIKDGKSGLLLVEKKGIKIIVQ